MKKTSPSLLFTLLSLDTHPPTHTRPTARAAFQRDFFKFGGEYLESIGLSELRDFFRAFFKLPYKQWTDFLSSRMMEVPPPFPPPLSPSLVVSRVAVKAERGGRARLVSSRMRGG